MSKTTIKKESLETIFLTFYLSISPISKLLEKLLIPRPVTYLLMIIACAVYILNRYRLSKLKLDVLIAFLILTPILLLGVGLHHADFNSANEMYAMIIIFYPAYFIMRVADVDKLIRALHYSAYIGVVIYMPSAFWDDTIRSRYISYSYDLLLPLAVVLYYAINDKHWYDIVIAIVGTIMLAIFGSRGALIALALFYFYTKLGEKKLKSVLLTVSLVLLVFLLYANLGSILVWLKRYGISSYALTRIANEQAFTSVTRVMLYEYITSKLLPGNYFGFGPIGNRSLMPRVRYQDQPYPHQLFLELLIDYGWILGIIFSVAIIYVTVYLLIKAKGRYRYLAGIYCVLCLFPLMLSGTFYATGTIPYIFALYMKCREELRWKPQGRRLPGTP